MHTNVRSKPHNLVHLHRDRGYRFSRGDRRDPIMEEVCSLIDKSGMSINDILEGVLDASNNSVHISYGTISHWLDGTTMRPQNFTLTWVLRALGYDRILVRKEAKEKLG